MIERPPNGEPGKRPGLAGLAQSLDGPAGHGFEDKPRARRNDGDKQHDQHRINQAVFSFSVHGRDADESGANYFVARALSRLFGNRGRHRPFPRTGRQPTFTGSNSESGQRI
jgi:hypothetical protein